MDYTVLYLLGINQLSSDSPKLDPFWQRQPESSFYFHFFAIRFSACCHHLQGHHNIRSNLGFGTVQQWYGLGGWNSNNYSERQSVKQLVCTAVSEAVWMLRVSHVLVDVLFYPRVWMHLEGSSSALLSLSGSPIMELLLPGNRLPMEIKLYLSVSLLHSGVWMPESSIPKCLMKTLLSFPGFEMVLHSAFR